jgi:hypothetical protein
MADTPNEEPEISYGPTYEGFNNTNEETSELFKKAVQIRGEMMINLFSHLCR